VYNAEAAVIVDRILQRNIQNSTRRQGIGPSDDEAVRTLLGRLGCLDISSPDFLSQSSVPPTPVHMMKALTLVPDTVLNVAATPGFTPTKTQQLQTSATESNQLNEGGEFDEHVECSQPHMLPDAEVECSQPVNCSQLDAEVECSQPEDYSRLDAEVECSQPEDYSQLDAEVECSQPEDYSRLEADVGCSQAAGNEADVERLDRRYFPPAPCSLITRRCVWWAVRDTEILSACAPIRRQLLAAAGGGGSVLKFRPETSGDDPLTLNINLPRVGPSTVERQNRRRQLLAAVGGGGSVLRSRGSLQRAATDPGPAAAADAADQPQGSEKRSPLAVKSSTQHPVYFLSDSRLNLCRGRRDHDSTAGG
jgi:hypothetical protein